MAEEWAELDTKAPPATEAREREMRGREGRRDADGGGGDSRSSGRRGRGGATQANHRRSSAAIANNTASPKFSRAYDRSPAFPGHHDPVSADMKGAGGGGCVRAARGKKSGAVHTVTGILHVRFGDRFDRSVRSFGVRFGGGVLFTRL